MHSYCWIGEWRTVCRYGDCSQMKSLNSEGFFAFRLEEFIGFVAKVEAITASIRFMGQRSTFASQNLFTSRTRRIVINSIENLPTISVAGNYVLLFFQDARCRSNYLYLKNEKKKNNIPPDVSLFCIVVSEAERKTGWESISRYHFIPNAYAHHAHAKRI